VTVDSDRWSVVLEAAVEHAAYRLGAALRRHGPGDWMLPGQFTLVELVTMSFKAASSAASSRTNVYVADTGPPGSELFSQLTCASAYSGVTIGLHEPEG